MKILISLSIAILIFNFSFSQLPSGLIMRSDEHKLGNYGDGIDGFNYEKQGDPSPFGIGKDSFFVCFWSRI